MKTLKKINNITNDNVENKRAELPFFKGRISKKEFTWSYFTCYFVNIFLFIMASGCSDSATLIFIVNIILAILTASLIVQRLHDLGRPGYHFWLTLIPIYNLIFVLYDLCGKNGELSINKYGNIPNR